MWSVYANVCNVASTREQFVLLFGTNPWNPNQKELTVQSSDRMVMSPFAAKQLAVLLENVLRDHEARYGTLEVVPGVSRTWCLNKGQVSAAPPKPTSASKHRVLN